MCDVVLGCLRITTVDVIGPRLAPSLSTNVDFEQFKTFFYRIFYKHVDFIFNKNNCY